MKVLHQIDDKRLHKINREEMLITVFVAGHYTVARFVLYRDKIPAVQTANKHALAYFIMNLAKSATKQNNYNIMTLYKQDGK